jgi:hypothetical protein
MTRLTVTIASLALSATTLGCATAPRFRHQPIVWEVKDNKHIDEPEERDYYAMEYFTKIFVTRRLTRTLDIPTREPARNVNALGEVPDSSWFTNRIGRFDISAARAAKGPNQIGPPVTPFVVVAGKSGGGNPGFLIKDGTGRRFVVKLDTKENPEMQTGGNVVVNRIFWTVGYNVPSDNVFFLRRSDLSIKPGAKYKNALKQKMALTWEVLDDALKTSPLLPNGGYRLMASEFISGTPKGGFSPEGTRSDDANDTVPHEHRRELRGLRVFSAWVNHTDMKEDNTLDAYVEEGGRKFLRHYLLDFGEALGGHVAEKGRPEDGWEHFFDWDQGTKATLSFGLWKRPWEDTVYTPWPSIGPYAAEPFEPEQWREAYPFWPFHEMDESDAYWAAKLVLRFDKPMLRAIVAEAKYTDADAAEYLVNALYERGRKIGHTWLEAVTPFDALRIENGQLCGYDLGVHHGLAKHGVVERLKKNFRVRETEEEDESDFKYGIVSERTVDRSGRACFPLPKHDRYTVYRLRIRRASERKPIMQVHLKGGKHPTILGVVRMEK